MSFILMNKLHFYKIHLDEFHLHHVFTFKVVSLNWSEGLWLIKGLEINLHMANLTITDKFIFIYFFVPELNPAAIVDEKLGAGVLGGSGLAEVTKILENIWK